jgi:hypothetical protein
MSEQNETSEQNKPSEKYLAAREAAQPDPVLGVLANYALLDDGVLGITLTVGGTLITGRMVGRGAWVKDLREHFGDNVAFMDGFADGWREQDEQWAAEDDEDQAEPPYSTFIHLVDARVVTSAGFMPNGGRGAFWRGRLSEVQGWSLGTMESE